MWELNHILLNNERGNKKYLETNENKAQHTKTSRVPQNLMKKEVYSHNPYIKGRKISQ